MILWTVFFLSFSSLAFEIFLTRLFSISQRNHLSFMVISIALLGFAAGGVLFSFLDGRMPGWERKWSTWIHLDILAFAFSISILFSLFILSRIPFDYFRLPFEPIQILYLFILYLVLGVAFFFCGLAIMIGYAACPEKSGSLYFASMAGSACGAAASIPLLSLFGETGAAALSALIPLIPAAGDGLKSLLQNFFHKPFLSQTKGVSLAMLTAVVILCVFAVFLFSGTNALLQIRPSPYKALSQSLQFPDSQVFQKASGIYGRVDCLQSPHLRYAPGLSLKYPSIPPTQWAAFKDGDHPLTFYETNSNTAFARSTLQYAGYVLIPNPGRVLIIQPGGGTAIPCALASGAESITVVEPHPFLAQLTQKHYRITVVSDTPRAFLTAPGPTFDVIHVENWGPSLPGTGALTQDYLLTLDAFAAYLNRLSHRGILIVSRKLRLPPADSLRLWSTAYTCLVQKGVSDPGRHILILRNWDTFVLIASGSALPDTAPLIDFANRLNFDFIFSKISVAHPVNRFNRLPEPYYHRALSELSDAYERGKPETFFNDYLIDVKPLTDERPFPDRFIKYDRIRTLYRSTGSRFYSLFMSGEIVVWVVMIEAAAISILFLLLPLSSIYRRGKKQFPSYFLFFFFVGMGFMFLEMYFVQAFTLLLGDPVVSFVAGITGILIFSGVGGRISQNLGKGAMQKSLLALTILAAISYWMLDSGIHQALRLPKMSRTVFALILLLPMGLPAGLPFPMGMRILLDGPQQRAFAWAANGCASVLTAVASVQIAIGFGISTNLLFAAASYFSAWLCIQKHVSQKGTA